VLAIDLSAWRENGGESGSESGLAGELEKTGAVDWPAGEEICFENSGAAMPKPGGDSAGERKSAKAKITGEIKAMAKYAGAASLINQQESAAQWRPAAGENGAAS